jgi:hypothetical protein
MGKVDEIKLAVREFEDLQDKFDDFGAADTEPETVFQLVLKRAFQGKDYLPKDARSWQLYADSPGVDAAAKALTLAADKIRKMIQKTTIGEAARLEEHLVDYCWRVNWSAKALFDSTGDDE